MPERIIQPEIPPVCQTLRHLEFDTKINKISYEKSTKKDRVSA